MLTVEEEPLLVVVVEPPEEPPPLEEEPDLGGYFSPELAQLPALGASDGVHL